MSSSHHLALPYLAAAQASKHITHNEALKALDAVVQVGVISRGLATAPASPAEGDRYLVPSGGADAFAGHDGELAAFADGAWSFHTPKAGWIIWVEDESGLIVFDGTAWVSTIPPLVSELGVGTSPDATNRFAV
ncbi:MAG: DUF2793 domain-containing protein, partial [Devosiaceae bacterium]|nr:DUF2793 domain-containing protein [Devosiaceae bacterium MH13]